MKTRDFDFWLLAAAALISSCLGSAVTLFLFHAFGG